MTRPGYKMTEIGEIPEEWKTRIFKQDMILRRKETKGKNDKINIIPMELIPEDGLFCKYREASLGEVIPPTYCETGDILFPKITPSVENGKQCIVPDLPKGYSFSTSEVFAIVASKSWDNRFIFYLLKLNHFRQNLINSMVGTTGRQRVTKEALMNLVLPFPTLLEQQKIAEILSTTDETMQKVEEEIKLTERIKKGLMQTLLTRGIGHTKFKMTEIGEIPEEWDIKQLHEVADVRKEIVQPIEYESEHYVGLENITSGQLKIFTYGDPSNLKSSKFMFKVGDVLYGKLRPYLDKVAVAETGGICSTDIIPIVSKNSDVRFLAYILHSDSFLRFVESTTSGTNHPRTSWKLMSLFILPFPPLIEQQKIADILSTADNKIELLKNKKEHLEKMKRGLMNDLLTGKVRVKLDSFRGEN